MTKTNIKEVDEKTVQTVLNSLAGIEVFPWSSENTVVGTLNVPDSDQVITVTQQPLGQSPDCQNQDPFISSSTPCLKGEVVKLLNNGHGHSFKVGVRHHGDMRTFKVEIN